VVIREAEEGPGRGNKTLKKMEAIWHGLNPYPGGPEVHDCVKAYPHCQ